MTLSVRGRLLGGTTFAGAALLSLGATTAFAAEIDAPITAKNADLVLTADGGGQASAADISPTAAPAAVQEVVVTGSRIRSPGLVSTSPLTVVGQQQFLSTGAVDVTQVLDQLPSVIASQSSGLSGLSNGTATVNLRGLSGTTAADHSRTLVLVDGKRLMPGDPTDASADLNNIPSALIDHVEVVTGGASSVYGSDAVAGVVNFIMKKDFQGVRIEATDNFGNHTNNDSTLRGFVTDSGFTPAPGGNQTTNLSEQVTAIIGVNAPDGKGNITAYGSYRNLEPILESKYDVSACTISAAPSDAAHYAAGIYNTHACGGSSNGIYGKFVPTSTGPNNAAQYGVNPKTTFHDNPNGTQSFVTTSVPSYNYGASNYFQRSETRYTAGFSGHYDVNPIFDLYSDFMFADDHSVGQIAPSGLFDGTGANGGSTFNINCNNPLLTGAQQQALCGTAAGTPTQVAYQVGDRFASFPRQYGFGHTSYRLDVGSKGDLGEGWTYDAYLQYGHTILQNQVFNDTSTTNIQNALLVDPTTGACISGGSCVPLNIFKVGGVTTAAFNYASIPAFEDGSTTEQIASASVTGDLGQYGAKSPWARDGIGVAFGTEYRRENLVFQPDATYQAKVLSGTDPEEPNAGTYDVYELFGEGRIPVIQDRPFVKNLSFDVGYRFSDYSTAGKTDTYKIQFDYSPTSDVRFRGGYNRATRAPNVTELFKARTVSLAGATDPCLGATPTASLAACQATGLPTALYGNLAINNACPAGQCGALEGGNAALKPEIADTYTAGVVFTPTMTWARGFTLSVDYYNIQVSNQITAIATSVSSAECAANVIAFCQLFHRDPTTYIIFGQNGYINNTELNSGNLHTDGVDVEANYRKRLSDWGLPNVGTMVWNLVGNWTDTFDDKIVNGGPSYNCAGLYGKTCGNPDPRFKGSMRLTFLPTNLPVSGTVTVRYVGDVHLDSNTSNPLLANHPYGTTDFADNSIHPYEYLDLAITWHVRDNITMNAGCNNVLDRDPPVVDSGSYVDAGTTAGNGNTYPGVYDTLGRTLFVTLTADF